jgi:DDE superfamily endonuclease/Helix-turn-helix of DDE superfamily endonuclease
MNIVLDHIRKYPTRIKQILGIDKEQYQSLVVCAIAHDEERKKIKESQKRRVNAPGGGRTEILEKEEQILLCLFYLRHMPNFEVLGMMFGVSKTEANVTFHYWRTIIREILPASLLEEVSERESDLEIVKEILTDFQLLVDSAEQAINRPSQPEKQKECYSGKKRQHTIKIQFVGMPNVKDIVDVEVSYPGLTADINIFRKQQEKFNSQQGFGGDKAYQGGKNIKTPHKKKRNQELTETQKEENQVFSSKRIYIEHLIRIVRIFKIASQKFKLRMNVYDDIILTVSGLVRLRIGSFILRVT